MILKRRSHLPPAPRPNSHRRCQNFHGILALRERVWLYRMKEEILAVLYRQVVDLLGMLSIWKVPFR